MNVNFWNLFELFFQETLARWIPGLQYKHGLTEQEIHSLSQSSLAEYDSDLRCNNHCVFVEEEHILFFRNQEIKGIDRALIDWTIGKTLHYSGIANDSFIKCALKANIPLFLISTYLIFPDFNLNSPWKQFGAKISYFGATEEHYEIQVRPEFTNGELAQIDRIFDVISSVEKFSESTNEGARFPFTLAVIINKSIEIDSPLLWHDLIRKQFIKSLSSRNNIFIINEKGEYLDYMPPPSEGVPDFLKSIIPQSRTFPGDEYLTNYIQAHQLNQRDQDVFILSVKENGDIFLYKNHSFNFYKRKGMWNYFNYLSVGSIVSIISPSYHEESSTEESPMYCPANDDLINTIIAMFSEQVGCCLGIIPPGKWNENFKDKIIRGDADHFIQISSSIDQVFWKNDIEVRKKLLSIDGAVLIDSETGKLLGVGTIIPNEGDASEGARTVATKAIAAMGGFAIKVSDDGYCSIYVPSTDGAEPTVYHIGK